MSQDCSVKQIHNRRQVDLGACDSELGDIANPRFIRCTLLEVAVKHVIGNVAHSSAVGVVLLTPDLRYQSQLSNQLADQLLIDDLILIEQRTTYAAIAIRGMRVVKDLRYQFLQIGIFVRFIKTTLMFEEGRPGQARYGDQVIETVVRLDSDDGFDF